ncbi:acetyltransferase [Caballeronia mineralivorans PML1(12)]|uniref:Acetyltransferase n=1 Tax=Caballeronia mineralivorans PML1(12) TaxID=908627 RepID=A0A0J1CP27_9BURK|nr:GNAT family acetyltransferase [Caballeronia mineralivorans]KLU22359.1 acetyltransferase [Caballeronia mineralivorans PML1(12)]
MIIRVFDERDTQAVLALWSEAFPEYATPGKPQRDPRLSIRNKLAMQPELFFVGWLNERLIGTVMAGYDGHRGWLYSLAVAEDQRGNGYGRALVEHAERALACIGCPKLNLQIMANKPEAQGFYAKLGYQMDEVVSFGKRL